MHGLCYASVTYDTCMGCAMQVQPMTHAWAVLCLGLCYASATYDTCMGCAMQVQLMTHAWKYQVCLELHSNILGGHSFMGVRGGGIIVHGLEPPLAIF